MMFFKSPFHIPAINTISDDCKCIIVHDLMSSDYAGGAEITTDALQSVSPYKFSRIRSRDITSELISRHSSKYWIFGNFSEIDFNLLPTIISNLRYSIIEYDYKFCKYRSPEKHEMVEHITCDCYNQQVGKIVEAFMLHADTLNWMSVKQMDLYHNRFPKLADKDNFILSSVFDVNSLNKMKEMRNLSKIKNGWVFINSPSWIKGSDDARQWCVDSKYSNKGLWNIPYDDVLRELSTSEGFVSLPPGGDTCPRMVIEAKLLGCKLHLNENVQHAKEEWFDTEDLDAIEKYLIERPKEFWSRLSEKIDYRPTLSGYTTTYNSKMRGYPFVECIRSMLGFCDEVVVVDAGSDDGTWDILNRYFGEDKRVMFHMERRDMDHPRFAIRSDGMLKALARSLCTKDFCWQMDNDEIVDDSDFGKIRDLITRFPKGVDLMALPVVEYWGDKGKVRYDVNPWKWRISRNQSYITHGPPANLRRYDSNGDLYCAQGTDSCDYIRADNFQPIQFISFYNENIHKFRLGCVNGDQSSVRDYEKWFNEIVRMLPTVFHFSWWKMKDKVHSYKDHWYRFWNSMYSDDPNKKYDDTSENNVMFDCSWSDVTDDMIAERSREIIDNLGGWIWHRKWDGKTKTGHIAITSRDVPKIMNLWIRS